MTDCSECKKQQTYKQTPCQACLYGLHAELTDGDGSPIAPCVLWVGWGIEKQATQGV